MRNDYHRKGPPLGILQVKSLSASLSLQLPHSDLSFVESDSDGEWSGTSRRRRESSILRRYRKIHSTEDKSSEGEGGGLARLRQSVSDGLSAFCNSQASDITTKLLWLSVFHSATSRRAVQFECTAVLGPSLIRLCTFLSRIQSTTDLPRPLPHILDFLDSCRIPAVISLAYQGMRWLFRNPVPVATGPQVLLTPVYNDRDQLRQAILEMDVNVEDLVSLVKEQNPQTATHYAEIFKPLLLTFKRTLDQHQLETCRRMAVRFDNSDAELMRYLLASNVMEVKTNEEIERLFRETSAKLQETLHWIGSYGFIQDSVIKRHWGELVRWTKRLESGHPVLLVKLGLAFETCHGEKAEEYGRAIVSQVDRGVRRLLKNDHFVDDLITILDCEGASTANLNRIYGLLHSVPILLNKHYPHRLKSMHLVNVPMMMRWLIQLVKKFLHPKTQNKIVVYGRNSDSLPRELHEIVYMANDERFLPSTSGS